MFPIRLTILDDGSILELSKLRLKRYFKVPDSGKFIRLKHDYQTYQANQFNPYKPRTAAKATEVPETIHMSPFEGADYFVPLTVELQEFILATMRIANPYMTREDAIVRWHNLTMNSVCFTDKHSWDYGDHLIPPDPIKNYADYLFKVNLNNKPMAWKILGCGGNICKVVSGLTIEAIDYTKPLPNPSELYKEKPWLFQWATQCYWVETGKFEWIDGQNRKQYKVSRFPQMGTVNVLFPLFGANGVTRIAESWRVAPINNGVTYSPYVF